MGSCQVVFSDESRFAKNADWPWFWRRKGEYEEGAFVEAEKFAQSMMVFGAIGKGYKSKLFIIEGSLNQGRCLAMLEEIHLIDECDALFGRGNWRFMQDGASCHMGAETMATLSPLVHLVRGWPPNSPDLNPIETVCGWMKHAVHLQRAETLADFRRIVQDVWDSMAQERIDNLIDSCEARSRP
jgi:hypothetical protein